METELCRTISFFTRQGKEFKHTEKPRLRGRASVENLEKYDGVGREEKERGVIKRKPGSILRDSRSLEEWPEAFHAVCPSPSVSSGFPTTMIIVLSLFHNTCHGPGLKKTHISAMPG